MADDAADDGLLLNLEYDAGVEHHRLQGKQRGYQAKKARVRQMLHGGKAAKPAVPRRTTPVVQLREQPQQQQEQQEQQQQQQQQQPPSQPQTQQQQRQQWAQPDAGQHRQAGGQAQPRPPAAKPAATASQHKLDHAGQQPRKRQRREEPPEEHFVHGAEEDELGSLVALAMTNEARLQQELRQVRGTSTEGEEYVGVVEFGDAEDEPDWWHMQQHAQQKQQRQQQQGRQSQQRHQAGAASHPADAAAFTSSGAATQHGNGTHMNGKLTAQQRQAQQQRSSAQPAAQAKLPTLKPGELAHAAAEVPQGQMRTDLFGDSTAHGTGSADTFAGLGLAPLLAAHLEALNFMTPTRVQQQAVPLLLAGRDVMVRAPTGSGKTLTYLAPIVHDLQAQQPRITRADGTCAIILSPTRELCVQINDVLCALLRRFVWLVGGLVIGGEHRGHEKARLRKGVAVLVATPGRLLDHLQKTSSFKTDRLRWLVLDEADRLLDLGFEAKLHAILEAIATRSSTGPSGAGHEQQQQRHRQTVLLSATLHARLGALADLAMQQPIAVGFDAKALEGEEAGAASDEAAAAAAAAAAGGDGRGADKSGAATRGSAKTKPEGGDEAFEMPRQLRQLYVEVPAKLRLVALAGALRSRVQRNRTAKVVVFFSTCSAVDFHHSLLSGAAAGGSSAGGAEGSTARLLDCPVLKLHGDLPQAERTGAFLRFVKAPTGILLCTDVAARGLDFPAVSSILQFDPPGEPSEYVHRVGRTARMGQQGEALLFLLPSERQYVQLLQARGVQVAESQGGLAALFRSLPVAPQGKKKRSRHEAEDGGAFDAGAFALQRRLQGAVAADRALHAAAADAFRAHVRAYSAHPASVKHIFHLKSLHLGHLAHSFGLTETPGSLGSSGSAKERKERKRAATKQAANERRRAFKKGARTATAE